MPIDIRTLQALNVERMQRWHGESVWSPLEWGGAMAGETGEACNAAKKLKRVETQMANHDSRMFGRIEPLVVQADGYRRHVGKEVADAIIYGLLLASSVGMDVEDCIREVFNKKSEEYGFPERL